MPPRTSSSAPSRTATAGPTAPAASTPEKSGASPAATPLTATQSRYLRGMCHHLKPVIMLGAKGVTDAVTRELDNALEQHELVKVKLSGGDRDGCRQQTDMLTKATGASEVQSIGHVTCLFRRNTDEPKLALPR